MNVSLLSDHSQVYVDLDGVLADFAGHFETLYGVRPTVDRVKIPGFWKKMKAAKTFFHDLPLMPDARELWGGIKHLEPVILTGIPRTTTIPDAEEQKRQWVKRHFGEVPVIAVQWQDKAAHGKPGDILIDDWPVYRESWVAMGGIFVCHRTARETLDILTSLCDTPSRKEQDQ